MDFSVNSNTPLLDLSGAELYLDKDVRQNFKKFDPYNAWYFMSVNAHEGGRLYPIDDIRAFAFMLYFLLSHGLPKPKGIPMNSEVNFDSVKVGKQQAFSEVWIIIMAKKCATKLLILIIC